MTEFKPYDYPYQRAAIGLEEVQLLKPEDRNLPPRIAEAWAGIKRDFRNTQVILRISKGVQVKEPVYLDYGLNEDCPHLIEDNLIVAEANSQSIILMDYSSSPGGKGLIHKGRTKVIAEPGAQVTIVKLQRMGDEAQHEDYNTALVDKDANVKWFTVELGSKTAITTICNELAGKGSEAQAMALFLRDGQRKLEQIYEMIHYGEYSNSKVQSHGALQDQSQSRFIGTLDIKKGAKKTVAEEGQQVLLLDREVHAYAQPILLCGEDDVKVNHAASAGQLEENKLYYLMARGLTHQEAKKVIIEGSFQPLVSQIPLVEVRKRVQEEIARRLSHGSDL